MPTDRLGRPLRSLRLSVTDRCNLRCAYCMPEETGRWLPRADILTFEETRHLVGVFCSLGVRKVRLTGGEPLLRRDLDLLVAALRPLPGLEQIALTTNGLLLADHAEALRRAGLDRLTVSLDTLSPERFRAIARRDGLERVFAGLDAADAAGFRRTKIDTVVVRGLNDGEIADLLAFARERGYELRFIEYMDVAGATLWRPEDVVPIGEILAAVERRFGRPEPIPPADDVERSAPARRFALPDGTTFGVIASTTQPFCSSCDRARLTADGTLYLCLYARVGIDLKKPLRGGADETAIATRIASAWSAREERGAEERLALAERRPAASPGDLAEDPRLGMRARGG